MNKSNIATFNPFEKTAGSEAVENLFHQLPEGIEKIEVHIKLGQAVNIATKSTKINGLDYPIIFEPKFGEDHPTGVAEVWLEYQDKEINLSR